MATTVRSVATAATYPRHPAGPGGSVRRWWTDRAGCCPSTSSPGSRRVGRDRHGGRRLHRPPRPAVRQAVRRRLLPRARGRRGHPRLRLPADHRPRDGAGARLRVRRLGPRLRRRPPRPRPRHAARRGLARPQRAGALRRPPPDHPRPHRRGPAHDAAAPGGRACTRPGFTAMAATELEHFLFRTQLPGRRRAAGTPTSSRPGGTSRTTSSSRAPAPRTSTPRSAATSAASGVPVESSKGEWGLGQHEVNVRYADILEAADRHAVFKQCLKETADRQGVSVTFMAKPHADRAGSSCHVHLSLWRDGRNAFAGDEDLGVPGMRRIEGAALVPRRLPALGARAGGAARPHGELLQAVRRRVVGADPARVELRQPHGRVPAGRPRPEPPHRVPHPRRRLQPVPGARRAGRRAGGRDRAAGRTAAAVRRRCLRRRVARRRSPRSLRDATDAFEASTDGPRRAGRRRWSSTTSMRSGPSRPPSTPR